MQKQHPHQLKRKQQKSAQRNLPNFHDVFGPIDKFLLEFLKESVAYAHSKASEFLKNPLVKKRMESNFTKLYYKTLKEHGISLGSFVEVEKSFAITNQILKEKQVKKMSVFHKGDRFLILQINLEYMEASIYPSVWLTILHKDKLVSVDAFNMTSRVKERSVKCVGHGK